MNTSNEMMVDEKAFLGDATPAFMTWKAKPSQMAQLHKLSWVIKILSESVTISIVFQSFFNCAWIPDDF